MKLGIPHLQLDDDSQLNDQHVAAIVTCVFRQDLDEAGAICISFKNLRDSFQLRALMVKLKEQLSAWFQQQTGSRLHYYSMGRFDQKKTTRLHLDGGPACSFLMLGYEPSPVTSQFLIADFSRGAAQEGLSPQAFLESRNPMIDPEGRQVLEPFTAPIPSWDDLTTRIVLINNSSESTLLPCPFPALGVLHGADILSVPEPGSPRIINSTMLVPELEMPAENAQAVSTFLSTRSISGSIL